MRVLDSVAGALVIALPVRPTLATIRTVHPERRRHGGGPQVASGERREHRRESYPARDEAAGGVLSEDAGDW